MTGIPEGDRDCVCEKRHDLLRIIPAEFEPEPAIKVEGNPAVMLGGRRQKWHSMAAHDHVVKLERPDVVDGRIRKIRKIGIVHAGSFVPDGNFPVK
jgi:hypothetical protein